MSVLYRRIVFAVSAGLFAAALLYPSFVCQHGRPSWKGYEVLLIGWLGIIGLEPRWFTNVGLFFVLRWLLTSKEGAFPNKSAFFCLVVAIATPLIPPPIGCPGMDTPTAAIGTAVGGYLWVLALLVAVVGGFALKSPSPKRSD